MKTATVFIAKVLGFRTRFYLIRTVPLFSTKFSRLRPLSKNGTLMPELALTTP